MDASIFSRFDSDGFETAEYRQTKRNVVNDVKKLAEVKKRSQLLENKLAGLEALAEHAENMRYRSEFELEKVDIRLIVIQSFLYLTLGSLMGISIPTTI